MYRTRTCGDLRLADEGLVITLAGWVQKTRKMGVRKQLGSSFRPQRLPDIHRQMVR